MTFTISKGIPAPTKETSKREGIVTAGIVYLHENGAVGDSIEIPRSAAQTRQARSRMRVTFAEAGESLNIVCAPMPKDAKGIASCRIWKVSDSDFAASVSAER